MEETESNTQTHQIGQAGQLGHHTDTQKPIAQPSAKKRHPITSSNILTQLTFSWLSQVLRTSSKTAWTQEMHYPLPKYDTLPNHQPSLSKRVPNGVFKAILVTYRYRFLEYFIATVVTAILKFSVSIFTSRALDTITGGKNIRDPEIFRRLCLDFALIAIFDTMSSILSTFFTFRLQRAAIGIRSSLYAILQEKIIASNMLNSEEFTEGFVTNLIQIDAVEISSLVDSISALIDTIVNSVIACFYMAYIVGWKLLGLSMMIYLLSNLLYIFVFWLRYYVTKKYLQAKDLRMSLFTDVMQNIEFIKSRALENRFCVELFQRREKEVEHLRGFAAVLSADRFAGDVASVMTVLSVIYYFVNFDSGISFGEFTAFNQILNTALYKLINIFYNFLFIFERIPNIQRMNSFLGTVETTRTEVELVVDSQEEEFGGNGLFDAKNLDRKKVVLSIENGFFKWNDNSPEVEEVIAATQNSKKDQKKAKKKNKNKVAALSNPLTMSHENDKQALIPDEMDSDQPQRFSYIEPEKFGLREINLEIPRGENSSSRTIKFR